MKITEPGIYEISRPVPGFYRRKLVKGGPYVAVLIELYPPVNDEGEPIDRDDARCFVEWPPLRCIVDGVERDVWDQWPYLEPIDEAEFRFLTDAAAWDRAHDPSAPLANPRKPIDLHNRPPLF